MRCFVSVNIPREVAQEIRKIQEELPEFQGKKTELENLHLTLKFLGEINEGKVEEVKKKLREIKFKKFESRIKYLGFFAKVKHGKRYGPVWLHLSRCGELQKITDDNLKNLFKPERRFMSHLTIARVKTIKDKKKFLEELKKIEVPKIKFDVDKFYLMKSELTSEGPKYGVLESYKLL